MAIKSQIRLQQLTGSLPDLKPSSIVVGAAVAAEDVKNVEDILEYYAQAISNIHGNTEFGAQSPGLIAAPSAGNYNLVLDQDDTGQKIHLDSEGTGADGVDIDSAGGIDIDASAAVTIDAADASHFKVASAGAADDLTIQLTGATDSSVFVLSSGTGTDAIDIDATAGSMLIGKSLADQKTLKIGKSGAVEMSFEPHDTAASEKWSLVNTAGTAADAIKLQSVAGSLLLTGSGVVKLDSDGTGTDAIDINARGGVDIDAGTAVDILATTTMTIKGGGVSKYGDDTATLDFDGAGAVSESGMTTLALTPSSTVVIQGGGQSDFGDDTGIFRFSGTGGLSTNGVTTVDLDGSGAVSINSSAAAINIGNDAVAQNISIGTAGARTLIALGSSAATETQIEGTLVDVNWGASGGLFAGAGTAVLDSTSNAVVISGSLGVALSGSGGVCFSDDGSMTSAGAGFVSGMKFSQWGEFSTFRAKSLFSASTTVVGALNALADGIQDAVVAVEVMTGSASKLQLKNLSDTMPAGKGYLTQINTSNCTPSNTEVYVNGQLMMSGSSAAGAGADYGLTYSAAPNAAINFQFGLEENDVVIIKTSASQ